MYGYNRPVSDVGHSRVGHSRSVIRSTFSVFHYREGKGSHSFHPVFRRIHAMASSDPFSSSVIPFEVPEQMRAFAEKGVSQARDSYAKFKDVGETHNRTVQAVISTVSKGASEYSAKLMEIMKASTAANLDFAQ